MSEVDVGSELTVDHYQPLSADGDDSDDNLVYACMKCNQYKGDFFPTDDDLAYGRRVLHPLRDDVSDHVRENRQTRHLEPLTETGRFHITILRLNRTALVEHRHQRQIVALFAENQGLLRAEIAQLRQTIAAQENYIAHLRQLLGLPATEDE